MNGKSNYVVVIPGVGVAATSASSREQAKEATLRAHGTIYVREMVHNSGGDRQCGPADLVEVQRSLYDSQTGSYASTKWCPYCGGIVVDEEFDGRVRPGGIMLMRWPKPKE
jgi:hypothetical protein